MKMELTALILGQAKDFIVMMAAGILTESLWQVKCFMQRRTAKKAKGDSLKKAGHAALLLTEITFWFAAAAVLSGFLYYCSYGKPSVHAAIGFLIGLLLWKKIIYYAILGS